MEKVKKVGEGKNGRGLFEMNITHICNHEVTERVEFISGASARRMAWLLCQRSCQKCKDEKRLNQKED